jgi:hypothetical protein
MITMLDEGKNEIQKLGSQYLSVIEIGGAYAHIFFDLLDFLDIRALVITDIDTVKANDNRKYKACEVHKGEKTSNQCIKSWFNDDITPPALLKMDVAKKTIAKRRIAYQLPEEPGGPCGRSFEDAFMLANPKLFSFVVGPSNPERETQAWNAAKDLKKSEFALEQALSDKAWQIPHYISEGLTWLADDDHSQPALSSVSGTAK